MRRRNVCIIILICIICLVALLTGNVDIAKQALAIINKTLGMVN